MVLEKLEFRFNRSWMAPHSMLFIDSGGGQTVWATFDEDQMEATLDTFIRNRFAGLDFVKEAFDDWLTDAVSGGPEISDEEAWNFDVYFGPQQIDGMDPNFDSKKFAIAEWDLPDDEIEQLSSVRGCTFSKDTIIQFVEVTYGSKVVDLLSLIPF